MTPMFKDVMISFRVSGAEGDVKFAISRPVMNFKGLRLIAEDDYGGMGTRILGIYIDGQRVTPQIPWWRRLIFRLKRQSLGIPTIAFGKGVMGNGLSLPICPANKEMAFEIEFVENSVWKADLHGKATTLNYDDIDQNR